MSHIARLAAIALAAALCACANEGQNFRTDPDFQSGYAAGCSAATTPSANFRQGPSRDDDMYDSNKAYRRGWGTGYSACRGANTPAPGANPVPSPSPGH